MDQKVKELIEIVDKFESRVNAGWNFYTVVTLAVIGWLVSSQVTFSSNQAFLATLVCLVFFSINLHLVHTATKRLTAAESELSAVAKRANFASETLRKELSQPSMPLRLSATYILHSCVDVIVLFAIWSRLS